jgi:hypothetical protein
VFVGMVDVGEVATRPGVWGICQGGVLARNLFSCHPTGSELAEVLTGLKRDQIPSRLPHCLVLLVGLFGCFAHMMLFLCHGSDFSKSGCVSKG